MQVKVNRRDGGSPIVLSAGESVKSFEQFVENLIELAGLIFLNSQGTKSFIPITNISTIEEYDAAKSDPKGSRRTARTRSA